MELPTVTTYSLTGGQGENKKVCLLMKKTRGVAPKVYSRKTLEKLKTRYANFENKGSGVIYT